MALWYFDALHLRISERLSSNKLFCGTYFDFLSNEAVVSGTSRFPPESNPGLNSCRQSLFSAVLFHNMCRFVGRYVAAEFRSFEFIYVYNQRSPYTLARVRFAAYNLGPPKYLPLLGSLGTKNGKSCPYSQHIQGSRTARPTAAMISH